MRQHIIVEGMDGTGKDWLIEELLELFPDHTLHERASTSRGGPVEDVAGWVVRDAPQMADAAPAIYNRHPLISEPIYAPLRHIQQGLRGVWTSPAWVDAYRRLVAKSSTVVICQPPYQVVADNLKKSGAQAHMAGVIENRWKLYKEYSEVLWPGNVLRYDYTKDKPSTLARIIKQCQGREG